MLLYNYGFSRVPERLGPLSPPCVCPTHPKICYLHFFQGFLGNFLGLEGRETRAPLIIDPGPLESSGLCLERALWSFPAGKLCPPEPDDWATDGEVGTDWEENPYQVGVCFCFYRLLSFFLREDF